jgi:hypothetical protein
MWDLVFHIIGKIDPKGDWKWGAGGSIWTYKGGTDWRLKKTA